MDTNSSENTIPAETQTVVKHTIPAWAQGKLNSVQTKVMTYFKNQEIYILMKLGLM